MTGGPVITFCGFSKSPGRIVAGILALLLLAAAVAKLSSFREWLPSDSGGSLAVKWQLALVGYEIALGFWLVSGVGIRWALTMSAVTFLVFAGATLGMVAHGISDCGCFGAFSVPPRVTYWVDVAALTAAVFVMIREHRATRFRIVLTLVSIAAAGFGTALVIAPSGLSPQAIDAGKLWPTEETVDFPADLSKGRWVVLIYDSDCHRCQSLAATYARDARGWGACQLALLDVNYTANFETGFGSDGVLRGRLLRTGLYHSSPIHLLLDQGRVLAHQEGWSTVEWAQTPFAFFETRGSEETK